MTMVIAMGCSKEEVETYDTQRTGLDIWVGTPVAVY